MRALADTGRIQHLFMDCNSIIYDLFHSLVEKEVVDEDRLIQQVIDKIADYVKYIRPSKTLYIAFDGVAPLAKMDQQRTRRHKGLWMPPSSAAAAAAPQKKEWSTCNITPGTPFMIKLSERVGTAFDPVSYGYSAGIDTVIVSAATGCGEGEHKLFQHIRRESTRWTTTSKKEKEKERWSEDNAAVYGLDSDLIMLSLFHCQHFKKLYVFRETPEFIKSQIPVSNDPCHFLDIAHLSSAILQEMRSDKSAGCAIYDYVFMCFLLGNDFLPHFPALNLRTHGLQVLLDTYRKVFSSTSTRGRGGGGGLIVPTNGSHAIDWKNVQRFLRALAKLEPELWSQEYETRAKWSNRKWSTANEKDCEFVLQNVPVIYRAEEMYIAPEHAGWEARYYRALLPQMTTRSDICRNYYEGLAWVFQYYTQDCLHWRWRYEYDYPPLLRDLAEAVPHVDVVYESHPPVSPQTQLAYVIPQELHADLLDPVMVRYLASRPQDLALFKRPAHCAFQWAFCRYFWEAHVHLAPIPVSTLEEWEKK